MSTKPTVDPTPPVDKLLPKLQRVHPRGPGRWGARCPAHNDRGPSLSIREVEDGRLLLHCFAGCDVHAIVSAIGLDVTDLFPPSDRPSAPLRPGERWVPRDALRSLAHEVSIAAVAADDVASGRPLSPEDRERVHLAASRIRGALEAL